MISTVFQESKSMGRLGPRSYEMCGAIRSLACDGCDGGANCLEFVERKVVIEKLFAWFLKCLHRVMLAISLYRNFIFWASVVIEKKHLAEWVRRTSRVECACFSCDQTQTRSR